MADPLFPTQQGRETAAQSLDLRGKPSFAPPGAVGGDFAGQAPTGAGQQQQQGGGGFSFKDFAAASLGGFGGALTGQPNFAAQQIMGRQQQQAAAQKAQLDQFFKSQQIVGNFLQRRRQTPFEQLPDFDANASTFLSSVPGGTATALYDFQKLDAEFVEGMLASDLLDFAFPTEKQGFNTIADVQAFMKKIASESPSDFNDRKKNVVETRIGDFTKKFPQLVTAVNNLAASGDKEAQDLFKRVGKNKSVWTDSDVLELNRLAKEKIAENLPFSFDAQEILVPRFFPDQVVSLGIGSGEGIIKRREADIQAQKEVDVSRRTAKGVNMLIQPGNRRRISFTNGRTFMEDGVEKNVDDFPGSRILSTTEVGTPEEIGGFGPGEKEREEAGAEARAATGQIATAINLMEQVNRVGPRGVGISGRIAEVGGGLLGNLSPAAGQSFTQFVAGVPAEQLSQLRFTGEAFVASMVPEVSGEESGRIPEVERKITSAAVKIRDPLASFAQIKGAIGAATVFALAEADKDKVIAGIPTQLDLDTLDGRKGQANEFLDLGLSVELAADALRLFVQQRRLLQQSGAPTQVQQVP